MKIGMRTPSLKRSISARTTGRAKRSFKRAINPVYGKKGRDYMNNPSKAIYNHVYHKVTVGANDAINAATTTHTSTNANGTHTGNTNKPVPSNKGVGFFGGVALIFKFIYYLIKLIFSLGAVIFWGVLLVGIIYILIKIII